MEVKKNGKMSEERRNRGTESYSYRRGCTLETMVDGNNITVSVSAETDELWEDIWMELPPEIETI